MNRQFYVESTDRTPGEYALFALTFFGVMIATAGVVLSSKLAAISGGVILLFALYWLGKVSANNE